MSRSLGAPVAIGLGLAVPPLFVWWFVSQERTIYFWDGANYWLLLNDLTERCRVSAWAGLAHAFASITTDKYNELAALPLVPAALLLGPTRVVYVVAVSLLFALPAVGLLAALVRRMSGGSLTRRSADAALPRQAMVDPALVAVVAAALLPQLWFPIVLGGLDVVGCIPILLLWVLVLPLVSRMPALPAPGRAFTVGVLLGLLPLLRRWYAFFAVTFLTAFWGFVLARILVATRGGDRRRALRDAGRASLAMLAGAALVASPLAGPVATSVFLRDHVHLHAPYLKTPGVLGALWRVWTYFGSAVLVLAGLGFVAALREPRLRGFAAFLALQAAATVLLFNRVQTLGANHFYLVLPTLLILESYALWWLLERLVRARWRDRTRVALGTALFALLAVNFAVVLLPPLSGSQWRTSPIVQAVFGRVRLTPSQRGDLDEIARLARAVEAARASDADAPVYVLASSELLNPDILRNAALSLPGREDVPDLRAAVSPGVHVDRRDGFPSDLLGARVVVTVEPPQVHLDPAAQQVVLVPLEQILAGRTIGRAFRALPQTFRLDGGATARVHVRDHEFEPADVRSFREALAPALAY